MFEKAGVSGEEYGRMMDIILVNARGGLKCGNGTGGGYKVTGTPAVFVNDRHINNSDFHGETPEIYHREYVDAVVELLKAGERCIFLPLHSFCANNFI